MGVRTFLTPFRTCTVPCTTTSAQLLDFRSARHSGGVGLFSSLQFLFPAFAARELVSSSGVQSFQRSAHLNSLRGRRRFPEGNPRTPALQNSRSWQSPFWRCVMTLAPELVPVDARQDFLGSCLLEGDPELERRARGLKRRAISHFHRFRNPFRRRSGSPAPSRQDRKHFRAHRALSAGPLFSGTHPAPSGSSPRSTARAYRFLRTHPDSNGDRRPRCHSANSSTAFR